jgi:hypothetical protein
VKIEPLKPASDSAGQVIIHCRKNHIARPWNQACAEGWVSAVSDDGKWLGYYACRYCAEHRDDLMMEPHTPSIYCESGKKPHCTCDLCY